jgi:hypothetical protein
MKRIYLLLCTFFQAGVEVTMVLPLGHFVSDILVDVGWLPRRMGTMPNRAKFPKRVSPMNSSRLVCKLFLVSCLVKIPVVAFRC